MSVHDQHASANRMIYLGKTFPMEEWRNFTDWRMRMLCLTALKASTCQSLKQLRAAFP
jgi:hypothetical protein